MSIVNITVTNPGGSSATLNNGFEYVAPWTPSNSALLAWYDRSDVNNLTLDTDGSNRVDQWDDISGNSHHMIGGPGNTRPIYDPILGMHWSSNGVVMTATTLTLSSSNPFACVAIYNHPTDPGQAFHYIWCAVDDDYIMSAKSNPRPRVSIGGSALDDTGSSFATGRKIMTAHYAGANSYMEEQNNFSRFEGTLSTTEADSVGIRFGINGGRTGGWLNGYIDELIFLDNPSQEDIWRAEGYAAHKWDEINGNTEHVDNLRADHPHKNAPPIVIQEQPQPDNDWTPADITTELWLDGTDMNLTGSDIDQFNDLSGNSRHASISTGSKATTTTINGIRAATFTGGGTYVTPTFAVPKPCTIYVVSSNTGGNGYRRILNIENDFNHFIGPTNNSGNVGIHTGDGSSWSTLVAASPETLFPTSVCCYVSRFAGDGATDLLTVINGTSLDAAPAGTWSGTSSGIRLGGLGASAIQRWIGDLCEVVIVSGADSQSDRERMEGYLAHRWGFETDLPASHPYKNSRPEAIQRWTPADITTAQWLDGSDSATITPDGDGDVAQWDDKSGNARHATPVSAGLGATPLTASINGLDTLDFNGSSSQRMTAPVPFSGSGDLYWVQKTSDSSYLIFHDGGVEFMLVAQDGSTSTQINFGSGTPTYRQDGILANWANRNAVHDDLAGVVTLVEAIGVDLSTYSKLDISNYTAAPVFYFDGELCEIIAVDGGASTTDREKIEGYLAHKWGFESRLDVSHPYKNSPP